MPPTPPIPHHALVLAGGLGTRLRAVTGDRLPKALVPVAGRPFLAWLLLDLLDAGIEQATLLTGHLADQIEAAFGGHFTASSRRVLRLRYSPEPTPLGTGGAVALAATRGFTSTEAPIVVVNGDTHVDLDWGALFAFHSTGGFAVSIALTRVEDAAPFGTVTLAEADNLHAIPRGPVRAFREKGAAGPGLVNAGVYIFAPEIFAELPASSFSLERDLFPRLVSQGRLGGIVAARSLHDIGTPESLAAFEAHLHRHGVEQGALPSAQP